MENDWHETKKEYDVNEKGEYIPRHVTMEKASKKILGFEKKDFWDQIIKSIGIVAIVVPLILFKCSQDADLNKQKTLLQLELFSNIAANVQTILLSPDTSQDFKKSKENLDIDYYAKIMLLGNDSIIQLYRQLKDTINVFTLLKQVNDLHASVSKELFYIETYFSSVKYPPGPADSILRSSSELLESRTEDWLSHKELIKQQKKDNQTKDANITASILDTLHYILSQTEPFIKSALDEKVVDRKNIATIDTLITMYFSKSNPCQRRLIDKDMAYKSSIDRIFNELDGMMKRANKILK